MPAPSKSKGREEFIVGQWNFENFVDSIISIILFYVEYSTFINTHYSSYRIITILLEAYKSSNTCSYLSQKWRFTIMQNINSLKMSFPNLCEIQDSRRSPEKWQWFKPWNWSDLLDTTRIKLRCLSLWNVSDFRWYLINAIQSSESIDTSSY
jgi:hypothetical protein